MVARVALVLLFVFAVARPAHAQESLEEDLWGSSPTKSTRKAASKPDDGKFGLGIAIGAPTGLTGKMRLNKVNAVDAAFAWSDSSFYLHSDYLFAGKNKLVDGRSADVGWFVGLGGRAVMLQDAQGGTAFVGMAAKKNGNGGGGVAGNGATSTSSNLGLGARIPAGLSLKFDAAKPLELYGEIALDVGIVNSDGTAILGAIGGRWFF